jgi:hypothetical protein
MSVQKIEPNAFLFWPCFAIPDTLETPKMIAVGVLLFGEALQPDFQQKGKNHDDFTQPCQLPRAGLTKRQTRQSA